MIIGKTMTTTELASTELANTARNPHYSYFDDPAWWFITKDKDDKYEYHYYLSRPDMSGCEFQTGILDAEDLYSHYIDSLDEVKVRNVVLDGKLQEVVEWECERMAFLAKNRLYGDIFVSRHNWRRNENSIYVLKAI